MIPLKPVVAHSFKLNITVLNLIGLYPLEKQSKFYTLYSYMLFSVALLPTLILGTLRFIFNGDLTNIGYSDFVMVGIMFYTFKLMPFLIYATKINKCIHYFDNLPYEILKRDEKILDECVDSCRRNTYIFFAGCIFGLTGIIAEIFLGEDSQKLPLNVWFPYTSDEKPVLFYCIYVIHIWGPIYSVFACGTIDPMVAGLAFHAAGQLRILKNNLQYLEEYVEEKSKKGEIKEETKTYEEIKICVHRYQKIVEFVELYKECFSQVAFSQFMGSVFVIGLCCLQISRMKEVNVDYVITVNCFGVLLFQLFFYCYYGTLLLEENHTLTSAIYMSNWYTYKVREQKALIILMERSKKPMILTAGKILDLSLDTFTMILKRSYSLLTVLNNYE